MFEPEIFRKQISRIEECTCGISGLVGATRSGLKRASHPIETESVENKVDGICFTTTKGFQYTHVTQGTKAALTTFVCSFSIPNPSFFLMVERAR